MLGSLAIGLTSIASLTLALQAPASARLNAWYDYSLATPFGVVPLDTVNLTYDRLHRELYVVGEGLVRVFNDSGMEIYTFGDDPEVGLISGIAALENGDLLVRTRRGEKLELVRCTFRGEFISTVEPTGIPAEYAAALSGIMRYQGGKLYFASPAQMRVMVLDENAAFVSGYDIAASLKVEDQRADLGLRGFNVDSDGNLLFTIQPLFGAYLMTPAGEIRQFGQRGSAPGKFNVVAGIARDDQGNLYVVDMLKSVVLVFDREYRFVREFGSRGRAPWNLLAPEEIVADGEGKLFVSNRARRGVSVFKVSSGIN